MLKTFAETQVEEGRQAHMREMEIVNRRVAELEEQQKQTVRAWEGRLAEANGRRTAEVAERDQIRMLFIAFGPIWGRGEL